MDADHERRRPERGSLSTALLADDEASCSNRSLVSEEDRGQEVQKLESCSSKALIIILGLQFLEIIAFYGVYLNLIVYLQDVLHGDSASNVATVSSWVGTTYLMPILGAALADSCWGKYTTVLAGFSIALVGMAIITASATLPSLRPPPCGQSAYCVPATLSQELVFFTGIYLCSLGIGGAKAVLIAFAPEQLDDDGGERERERKASYFIWYYAVANVGMLTAGTLLVWVEDKVSWGFGYGLCASFVAVAVVVLAATAPMYRILPPAGSPLKGVIQVLVAFSHKAKLTLPDDPTELYEDDGIKNSLLHPVHERLEHTDQFRCLDKAAIVSVEDLEDGDPRWRLCTVTQVEEVKILLRLIPIWLTSAVYFIANTQGQTTFVQQGTKTDGRIARGAFSIPAASLSSFQMAFVAVFVTLYNTAVVPAARRCLGRAGAFTPLQLMGFGHAAAVVAVGVAACTEARRLHAARAGAPAMGIAWLLPQYLVMAASDASLTVGQLEFFYDQSPETMRSASTAFYFLSFSLGNLLNSQLVTLVAKVTATGGSAGWFPPDLDDGHLDYFFLLIVAITAVNFSVYVALAKNYTPKKVSTAAMDAGDAMERGQQRSPRLPESRSPKLQDDDSLTVPLIQDKKSGSKAPSVVLGFECLESTAFNGIATNLVVYLETVLHGSSLASASNVTTWFGTSYLTPVFGAIIADTFFGNYNTILVSLVFYLLGMMLVTFSAFLPTTALCSVVGSSCQQPVFGAQTIAFVGLYLVAFGSGGVRAALLPFGAEQFDDDNAVDRERKMSFFSWFYMCVDFGMIVSGLFIVWIQQNVSWGLGFGIATVCVAIAFGGFVLATPMYKRSMPTGTPLKSLAQVVVASCRKVSLRVPADAALLYEVHDKIDQPKITHTDEFSFLDKAAVIVESDLEEDSNDASAAAAGSWRLCTVTQVEELKILLRLLPIWATSIVLSAAYAQLNTTFVQQGAAMNMRVMSFSIPAASMVSFEVFCVLAWVLMYGSVIVPLLRSFSPANGEPSQLRRMGAGRLLIAVAMAIAALVEMVRLDAAAHGESLSIAWQMPQYFMLAGGEVFCYIAQLEFFYNEAPESMKSICTSLALLTVALGSYMSSFIYAVVNAFTAVDGRPGWISDNLNEGHLDYFFWVMAALCTLNFVVYSAFARNYKVKTVVS
uniref:Uncharacterized protein n=1 Tax=Oryza punctata TaxID=4537 RepID=A0A0E0KUN0_ORYPU